MARWLFSLRSLEKGNNWFNKVLGGYKNGRCWKFQWRQKSNQYKSTWSSGTQTGNSQMCFRLDKAKPEHLGNNNRKQIFSKREQSGKQSCGGRPGQCCYKKWVLQGLCCSQNWLWRVLETRTWLSPFVLLWASSQIWNCAPPVLPGCVWRTL